MTSVVVVGTQWGDEGKGKITDFLSANAEVIARYQGVIADATQQNGGRNDAHEEEGHEEGEHDEGGLAHTGEELAADDEEYLIHGRGLREWRDRRRRCA